MNVKNQGIAEQSPVFFIVSSPVFRTWKYRRRTLHAEAVAAGSSLPSRTCLHPGTAILFDEFTVYLIALVSVRTD